MSFLLTIARLVSPNFRELARKTGLVQVLGICISHYSELACWALQLGGVRFQEHNYAPAQHVLPVLSLRISEKGEKFLSSSSRVVAVGEQEPLLSEEAAKKAKRKETSTRSTAVPVAVLPNQEILLDSWEIAAFSGLPAIDPALKKLLDEELGPAARHFVYCRFLLPQNIYIIDQLCLMGRGWFWRICWYVYVGGFTKKTLKKVYQPENVQAAEACRVKLEKVLKELEVILNNRQGPYLGGEKIGIADVALAALAAPLVNPPLYCGGKYGKIFASYLEHDAEANALTNHWRESAVGRYTLELYQKHRL